MRPASLPALGIALALLLGGCAPEGSARRALVLVVVDTLRADRVVDADPGRWAGAQLGSWLDRARVYERAFTTSPWTLPSFASMYTGQIPSRHGAGEVVGHQGRRDFTAIATSLGDGDRTLAEILKQHGFATAAVIGNAALAPEFGVDRGFDTYDYAPATNAVSRRADAVVERAFAWIDGVGDRPFFLVLHLFDPHMDYDPPPPVRGRFTRELSANLSLPVSGARRIAAHPERLGPAERAFVTAAYDEEVAFVDRQLARLLSGLESRGVLARGLVVLTADHGEELFDHGGFEHGHAMWDELLRLPLAFWGAGVSPGRDASPVSLVDLAPTFLDAAGLEPPEDLAGVSLLPGVRGGAAPPERPLFVERTLYGPEQKAVIRWPHKLVWEPDNGEQRLYDLERDPGERAPIDAPEIAATLLRSLQRAVREAEAARGATRPADLDDATLEALRDLGYAE